MRSGSCLRVLDGFRINWKKNFWVTKTPKTSKSTTKKILEKLIDGSVTLCLVGECLVGECLVGECLVGKCLVGKCLVGECLVGECLVHYASPLLVLILLNNPIMGPKIHVFYLFYLKSIYFQYFMQNRYIHSFSSAVEYIYIF